MNSNTKLFFKIHNLSGKSHWLDAFGIAGAEWAIVAMIAWYGVTVLVTRRPDWNLVFWPIAVLACTWLVAWGVDILIAEIVREPRPAVKYPHDVKPLFHPLVSTWKSFPSDHSMSAWLIVFMALLFNLPGVEGLVILALWVSFGRIYAGAHYPLDVLGGFGVALAAAIGSYALLLRI